MTPEQVRRRLARIHNLNPNTITRTDTENGITFDYQYDTYLTTEFQSSLVFRPTENVCPELRVRLPLVPNNATSGKEAKTIQRQLEADLADALESFTGGISPADMWPRVEISTQGFVMHVEARNISADRAFDLLSYLKDDYTQPDPDDVCSSH